MDLPHYAMSPELPRALCLGGQAVVNLFDEAPLRVGPYEVRCPETAYRSNRLSGSN